MAPHREPKQSTVEGGKEWLGKEADGAMGGFERVRKNHVTDEWKEGGKKNLEQPSETESVMLR